MEYLKSIINTTLSLFSLIWFIYILNFGGTMIFEKLQWMIVLLISNITLLILINYERIGNIIWSYFHNEPFKFYELIEAEEGSEEENYFKKLKKWKKSMNFKNQSRIILKKKKRKKTR